MTRPSGFSYAIFGLGLPWHASLLPLISDGYRFRRSAVIVVCTLPSERLGVEACLMALDDFFG